MSICASGASTTKAGVPAGVVVDQAYIQSLLPPALAFLYPFLPFMHGLEIGDVSAFCVADPPNIGSLPTKEQFFALLVGGPIADVLIVQQYMQDLTKNYLWRQLCKCTSGSTPAVTNPTDPGNLPVKNPSGYVGPPASVPCGDSGVQGPFSITNTSKLYTNLSITSQFTTYPRFSGAPAAPWQNATSYVARVSNVYGGAGTTASIIATPATTHNAGASYNEGPEYTIPSGGSVDIPWTFPFGDTLVGISYRLAGAATGTNLQVEYFLYCGVGPGGVAVPCCTPGPDLTGLVTQLLQAVTLIQRQAAPFGYVYGANHSGLTGHGSFAVSDLVGVSIDVTTLPSSYGQRDGTPVELFDLGFVSLGTADGYETSRRIDHDGLLVLPTAAGVFTTVGYTLSPGVEVSIRELVREP